MAVIEADGGKGEGEEDEVETLCKLAQVSNCRQDPLVLYNSFWWPGITPSDGLV